MSLLTDAIIRSLWDEAVAMPKEKHPSQTFWEYLLSNKYFTEAWFSLPLIWSPSTIELIAGEFSMRQNLSINIVVPAPDGTSISNITTRIFLVVESGPSDQPPKHVERLAIDACKAHLKSTGLTFVYAMTTIGTSAMMWKYQHHEGFMPCLEPLTYWDAYIEADSEQASRFSDWFDRMKEAPPQ